MTVTLRSLRVINRCSRSPISLPVAEPSISFRVRATTSTVVLVNRSIQAVAMLLQRLQQYQQDDSCLHCVCSCSEPRVSVELDLKDRVLGLRTLHLRTQSLHKRTIELYWPINNVDQVILLEGYAQPHARWWRWPLMSKKQAIYEIINIDSSTSTPHIPLSNSFLQMSTDAFSIQPISKSPCKSTITSRLASGFWLLPDALQGVPWSLISLD